MSNVVFVCTASDVREDADSGASALNDDIRRAGARSLMLSAYEVPRFFYRRYTKKLSSYGALFQYWHHHSHTGRKRRTPMDIDRMVALWKPVIVGLATAHDKDEADRFERQLDDCLSPVLTAPIRDVRVFAGRLLTAMKEDREVPFIVWRAYEVWVEEFVNKAPDGDLITLKTELAGEIAGMVEADLKPQLSTALVHALQWRSAERLQEVKAVIEREKAAGQGVRLRGRESCLFMESGGTEENPEVVIQI